MIERMKDDKSWSSYPNKFDRKRDRMIFSSKNKQIMFGEMLRQVLGWGGSRKRLAYWCSPGFISKKTGIPYSTVKRFFQELDERHIIKYDPDRFWEDKSRQNGWVEINPNVEEWEEGNR